MVAAGIDVATLSINYTGAHQDYGVVQMNDGDYRLLAFTSSGTLSIEQPVNCEVCVVGGGANGANAGGGTGGAGGYLKNQSVSAYNGGPVVVGARQGVSSIADVSVNAVYGQNGGTGGGGGYYWKGGTGDGLSKYPFGDTTYSLWASKPHCAGGGGGAIGSSYEAYERTYNGGYGGTNGGSGTNSDSSGLGYSGYGGGGGSYGGAAGAYASDIELENGDNATYYGSGGGGGAQYYYVYSEETKSVSSSGGSGYQGIVYMRIPVNQ